MNNNAFVSQFEKNIKFSYTSFDRVRIKGYIRRFFSEGAVVNFLRAKNFKKLSSGVLRTLTEQLNDHIKLEAQKLCVDRVWWDSIKKHGEKSKLNFVMKKYGKKYQGYGNFIYCIISARENVKTFGSKEYKSKSGKTCWRIYKCQKLVNQHYIYFHDEILGGPCYLKINSYLPFNCEFYFNGHNAVEMELRKRNICYKRKDNAFTDTENPEMLQEIANSFDGRKILNRIEYWMKKFFRFKNAKYTTTSKHLKHEWYSSQVETCTNVIFKSAKYCSSLFEKLLDKFSRFGLPDRICQLFSKRPRRLKAKSTWKRFNNDICIRHWFRNNSVKMYNKSGNFIRVETTINNPRSLGRKLKKSAIFLQSYLWSGTDTNNSFYNCCADIDISTLDSEQNDLFCKAIEVKGKRIAAPDLRKDRQIALYKELLKPKYVVNGFKTSDLLKNLSGYFRNTAEIRYELSKLRSRKAIQKLKDRLFYRVTNEGWKWLWLQICSCLHFKNPIFSKVLSKQVCRKCVQPSKIEQAYQLIDEGLSLFSQEVAVIL